MRAFFGFVTLIITLLLAGCSPALKEEEFIGIWTNKKEGCTIQLNRDFTFKATNLPLDVMHSYSLPFSEYENEWAGNWSVEGEQIKLTEDDFYYYLNTTHSFFGWGKWELYVILLDESGGAPITLKMQ